LRRADRGILALAGGIAVFGLVFVASATGHGATGSLGGQALRLAVALLFGLGCLLAPSRFLKRHSYLLYGLALLGLVGVLLAGRATNNARRWVDLPGGFKLQPSEFAKLGLLLALAKYASARRRLETIEGLVLPCALAVLPAVLVAAEPDLGTAIVFVPLLFGILYAGGARRGHLAALLALGLVALPAGSLLAMLSYQRERVVTWWEQDRLTADQKRGAGYHLFHSKVAVGAGGIAGQGIGAGTENRLDLLPERANDFVFAVVAEETGFLGGTLLVGLYGGLVLLLFGAASRLREPFDRLLVTGVACLFGTHLFVNVGVAIGTVPTTGLTLPFVSFGGSSTIAAAGALGLALNALARRELEFSEDAFA
jgi:rod shape determining protein RodA